jgi:iron(III) transport system ATP-binding protein
MKKAKVEFKNITKKFNNTVAVNNVSCTFEPGTLTTLLGPSGCGKTTSLRIIAGLERATSGQILIDGEDVTILPATERDVSMVFQSYALFPHMSVMENVSYGLRMINKNKEEYTEKTFNTLELVGLKGYQDRMPSELSGGQQQRVAVARAIVLEPKVLLFDEPLSNLDSKLRRQVREDIRFLQQSLSVTTIYVTHDQEEALAISDNIIVMKNAVIAQQGVPRDLYNYPNNKFVANFIGDSNIIKVSIVSHQEDNYEIKIDNKVFKIKSSIQANKDEPHVSIRPDKINILKTSKDNDLEGQIDSNSFVGGSIQYKVKTSIGEFYVIIYDTSNVFKKNEKIFLNFDSENIKIISD